MSARLAQPVQEPIAILHDDGYWTRINTPAGRAFADKRPLPPTKVYAAPVQPVQPAPLKGWKLVPIEPTPEIVAAAAIAVWPTASQADIDLARKAAPIVLMQSDLGPGFTVESLAAGLATMAPAYRAMIAAAPTTGEPT